ncbi:hypothetical protein RAH32_07300 [Paracoccus sp. WLY502]|uniref:hypothetical protein n=1 Tax=Paracoccus yibinensis TaxID=3068891 RepID=UPI002796A4E0|nr:hypothetical protein [Paracoccus sp. WLY502]MDQ1900246.1 hypothetical protein [Paracoccus sp. WLY502]
MKKRLYLPGRQPDDKLQMMNIKGGGPSSSFITMSAVDAVWQELRQERSQWLTEDA